VQTIETLRDIIQLKESGTLPVTIMNYLTLEFDYYKSELHDWEHIVLLQEADDLIRLSTSNPPEYVEKVALADRMVYKVAVLYDNDSMMFYYLDVIEWGNDVKDWLEEYVDEGVQIPWRKHSQQSKYRQGSTASPYGRNVGENSFFSNP